MRAGKTSKGDKLGPVDHSKMNYRPFRRNFYIEVPELARMTEAETAEYRTQLDGIKACDCLRLLCCCSVLYVPSVSWFASCSIAISPPNSVALFAAGAGRVMHGKKGC